MSTCNSKNFSGGYTPGPPLTGKGRGRKKGKRQGEGGGKEEGKTGKAWRRGREGGREQRGKARRRGREGRGKKGKGREDWPPQTKFLDPPLFTIKLNRLLFITELSAIN
jgi:hypothetical protein